MIYTYRCEVCGEILEIVQGMKDEHRYEHCGQECTRVYELKEVKKNEGFYSDQLGCHVDSQADYNQKLEEWRYKNDLNGYLGNNATPKDEWVEEHAKAHEKEVKEAENTEIAEDQYTSVTTYE